MKKIILPIVIYVLVLGCNMSDDVINLPGGHQYILEGRCTNRLFINLKDSPKDYLEPVIYCKYNPQFICIVSTDSINCRNDFIPISKRFYTVIEVKKEKIHFFKNKADFIIFWTKNIRDKDLKLE